jgi:hypothetical protein
MSKEKSVGPKPKWVEHGIDGDGWKHRCLTKDCGLGKDCVIKISLKSTSEPPETCPKANGGGNGDRDIKTDHSSGTSETYSDDGFEYPRYEAAAWDTRSQKR